MFKMDFINHLITITVYTDDFAVTRMFSVHEIITMMGFQNVAYHGETSLFCTACEVFESMDIEDMIIFIHYTEEDWENMADYVDEFIYSDSLNVVNCRKN